MKLLTLLSLMLISTFTFAQTNQNSVQDTLVFYQYIGGKPYMERVLKEKEIAEKWGFKIEYFFGDCGGTFDYKIEEFKILNEKNSALFIQKFGENWHDKFLVEVENSMKIKRNSNK